MTKIIKTNIKFYKGLKDEADKLYGFVTKVNGSWRGCRETEEKKKIVFVDPLISGNIIPNTLYRCTLIPMNKKNGFIVTYAALVKFKASIITCYRNNIHTIRVDFGNKSIVYDPSSSNKRENDIQQIADYLRNQIDLYRGYEVAEDFINQACIVKRLYNKSHVH